MIYRATININRPSTLFFMLFLLSSGLHADQSDIQNYIDITSLAPDNILMIAGEKAYDRIGLSVASGDINGDGFDDIVIGANVAEASGKTEAGITYVIWGSNQVSSGTQLDLGAHPSGVLRIEGANAGDNLGSWVIAADLDGDGYDDLIIPAEHATPYERSGAGKVYIIFGSEEITTYGTIKVSNYTGRMVTVSGEGNGDSLGFLGAKGDMNGDGYEDAILKAYLADPLGRNDAGTTYVVFGSTDLPGRGDIDLAGTPEGVLKVYGIGSYGNESDSDDEFGNNYVYSDSAPWATGCGDLNGDGYDDLLIGSRMGDPDGRRDAGETFVIFGSATITDVREIDLRDPVTGMMRITGTASGEQTGNIVVSGDVNKDGYDDAVINAISTGAVYVVFGNPDMKAGDSIPLNTSNAGISIIYGGGLISGVCPAIGDINGDGINDIVLGSAFAGSGGTSYIIFGSQDFQNRKSINISDSRPDVIKIIDGYSSEYFGFRTACGDINGDGYSDAIFSAHGANPLGKELAGKTYILWGRTTWGSSTPGPVTAHFHYEMNTGNNSIIVILSSALPVINGNPIATGDEIGVFTPAGLCAGAGVWSGSNLSITVWGNNSYSERINGFLAGERYMFKILDVSENTEYVVEPTYESGPETYQTDGISVLKSLENVLVTFSAPLMKGWNLISAPLRVQEKAIQTIFGDIADQVVCVKNGRGQAYLPVYNINQIGDWNITDGYQVYVKNDAELVISGSNVLPLDIAYTLPKNWSIISYVGFEGISPSIAFETLQDALILVKDGMGNVFWPAYEIDQIGSMHVGNGYWIYLSRPASFSYSTANAKKQAAQETALSHFIPVQNTGNNATILVTTDINPAIHNKPLSTGDEIGVFTQDNICAGAGVWVEGKNLAIAVWGNNDQTDVKDGFSPNEHYRFVVWSKATGDTMTVYASYTTGDGLYNPNDVEILGALSNNPTSTDDSLKPESFTLYQNHPNPFNPVTTISFLLPEGCKISLKVYNIQGEKVADLADAYFAAGSHTVEWNAEGCASGVYFYRLTAGGAVATKRMILIK